jgi:hypothetical protein
VSPAARKAALVLHVLSSVGWLGAVAASLILAVVGLKARDASVVRAAYLLLDPLGWYALLPFSLASLLTGLLQSLGTPWGLIRHYWVLAKLVLNLLAVTVLLLYTRTLDYLADRARTAADPEALRSPSPIVHASGAIVLLLIALILSIYKPRGVTGYGRRPARREVNT